MAQQELRALFAMLRGNTGGGYAFAPAMTGAGVGGKTLTTGNAAWPAAWEVIAAAGAIPTEYWIAGLAAYTPNQIQVWQVQLGTAAGAATKANFSIDITALTVNIPTMFLPIPVYMPANAELDGRAGGAGNAKTIAVHAVYLIGV